MPASRSKPSISRLPPRDAAGEDDRPRAEHVAAVEVHLARPGVDPLDRPGHEDLGAEPPRLLQRAARELVARHARAGSRGSSRSWTTPRPGRRAPLARPRSCAALPMRRRRPRRARPGPQPTITVSYSAAAGSVREPEQLGDPPQLRPRHRPAVDDPDAGQVAVVRKRPAPALRGIRLVRRAPR